VAGETQHRGTERQKHRDRETQRHWRGPRDRASGSRLFRFAVLGAAWRIGRDGAGEVFDGEELAVALEDGDADGVEVGVEEIGAVGPGVHPLGVDVSGGRSLGDVLGEGAEAGTGRGGARGKVGLAGELMRQPILLGHAQGVLVCSAGERRVPLQGRQALRGAVAVGGVEQGLFSGGFFGLSFWVGGFLLQISLLGAR
jgi:hypothetical protein